jgi:ferric-dicitrate binding protein FerR (iron transport regulator)
MKRADHTSADRAAICWLERQRSPEFREWHSLTAWLRASQANADAYARLVARNLAAANRSIPPPGATSAGHLSRGVLAAAIGAIIFIGATFLIAHQLSRGSRPQPSHCRE